MYRSMNRQESSLTCARIVSISSVLLRPHRHSDTAPPPGPRLPKNRNSLSRPLSASLFLPHHQLLLLLLCLAHGLAPKSCRIAPPSLPPTFTSELKTTSAATVASPSPPSSQTKQLKHDMIYIHRIVLPITSLFFFFSFLTPLFLFLFLVRRIPYTYRTRIPSSSPPTFLFLLLLRFNPLCAICQISFFLKLAFSLRVFLFV